MLKKTIIGLFIFFCAIFACLKVVMIYYDYKVKDFKENSLQIIEIINNEHRLTIHDFYQNDFDYVCIMFPYEAILEFKGKINISAKIKEPDEAIYSLLFFKNNEFYEKKFFKNIRINDRLFSFGFQIMEGLREQNVSNKCFYKENISISIDKKDTKYTVVFSPVL